MEDTQVKIFGTYYHFKSDCKKNEELFQIATSLDKQMKDLAIRYNDIRPLRMAILAAMNLLDENREMKLTLSRQARLLEAKVGAKGIEAKSTSPSS